MAIRSFSVGPLKGLRRASADHLRNIVAIAGPNGSGKTSVLDLIRTNKHLFLEPGTELLFMGAHRSWRGSSISRMQVYSYPLSTYADLLASDQIPGFAFGATPGPWMALQNQPRDSRNGDDAQAFVKLSLVKLRDRQLALVGDAWTANSGAVPEGSVPDLFGPFSQMISVLLPHLRWAGIEEVSETEIRCLFQAADSGARYDIDDLSSGEKAAVALFLPFVERQAAALVSGVPLTPGLTPITFLVDEPELHLHPLLQLQALQYMRMLAARDEAQFIFTTHSPTMLDALTNEELYLLSPAAISEDNQLSSLANDFERLEIAREITGATYVLTRSKPIVLVEGEIPKAGRIGDSGWIGLMLPDTRHWSLIPSGGKREVLSAVERLREASPNVPGLPVFGLIDSDQGTAEIDGHIVSWPVAMIENLLLDPDAIASVLAPLFPLDARPTATSVAAAISAVTDQMVESEIRLRVMAGLPVAHLRFDPDAGPPSEQAGAAANQWASQIETMDPASLAEAARTEVLAIVASGKQSERFHGKRALRAVFDLLGGAGAGLSTGAFAAQVALAVRGGDRLKRLASPAIQRIQLYFPSDLEIALRELPDSEERDLLVADSGRHFDLWIAGTPDSAERVDFRRRVFALASTQEDPARQLISKLASEIGTV